jgi:CBS domain-containing protein
MSWTAVAIRAEATLCDAVKTLTDLQLSGAPVISPEGRLVGFIAEKALLDILFDPVARAATVSQYMSTPVHAVRPEDPLSKAARLFAMFGTRRLPVVEQGKLVGVVTRRDLLRYALHHAEPLEDPLVELIPADGRIA